MRRDARGVESSTSGSKASTPETGAADTSPAAADGSAVSTSNLSLHDLFEQQARHYLEHADLDEEQKQAILVALSCPCCGAGGMSFSVRLKDPGP
jgi:hypothetical protein